MWKAIFTAIITVFVGLVFAAIGNDLLNGFSEIGVIVAVAVASGLTIFFNQKNKKREIFSLFFYVLFFNILLLFRYCSFLWLLHTWFQLLQKSQCRMKLVMIMKD